MSIPLHRLYHFLENLNKEDILIYLFYPHGSKNLENLVCHRAGSFSPFQKYTTPAMICHDQEPLTFALYSKEICTDFCKTTLQKYQTLSEKEIDCVSKINTNMNLRLALDQPFNCYDFVLLLNSEKRSENLQTYEKNGFIGVYYLSHAMIALDWYRYAQHVKVTKSRDKIFLCYNRAWTGSREYRLKLADLLISPGLVDACRTTVNSVDPESGIHYSDHTFENPVWKPKHALENYFSPTQASSDSSADFVISDYETTDIEIVLETLYDDGRLHLTEKTLRPIAMAQPFILAATQGSLQYLREYGFKTFDSVWNEDYDNIPDPAQRLLAIVELMKEIENWGPEIRTSKINQAQQIADYNKKLFFSSGWQQALIDEYKNNLEVAMDKMKSNCTGKHFLALLDSIEHLLPELPPEQKQQKQKLRADVLDWIKNPVHALVR